MLPLQLFLFSSCQKSRLGSSCLCYVKQNGFVQDGYFTSLLTTYNSDVLLLRAYQDEDDAFSNNLFTSDEILVHYSKAQSKRSTQTCIQPVK